MLFRAKGLVGGVSANAWWAGIDGESLSRTEEKLTFSLLAQIPYDWPGQDYMSERLFTTCVRRKVVRCMMLEGQFRTMTDQV